VQTCVHTCLHFISTYISYLPTYAYVVQLRTLRLLVRLGTGYGRYVSRDWGLAPIATLYFIAIPDKISGSNPSESLVKRLRDQEKGYHNIYI
jgi:hypothetical protein